MRLRIVGVLIAGSLLVLTGCGNSGTGGGWHYSDSNYTTNETKRATFGFQWQCDPNTDTYRGQMNFTDRGAKVEGYVVSFHAFVQPSQEAIECDTSVSFGVYAGEYQPIPRNLSGDGGDILLAFQDGGQPGSGDDILCLMLDGGAFDGYTSCSSLAGGNIKVKVTS